MKITANMVVFDEQDYLESALKSIYNHVDKIVIVEGCAKLYKDFATSEGLSQDQTGHIIRDFPDPGKKIDYIKYGFCEKVSDLRNIALQRTDEDTDYVLVADGDTLFRGEELSKVKRLVQKYPNIRAVNILHLMFFWDMHHILTVGAKYREKTVYHSPLFFWKYVPNLEYSSGQVLMLDGELYWYSVPKVTLSELEAGMKDPCVLRDPPFSLYHCGWVRHKDRLNMHIYQRIKGSVVLSEARCKAAGLDKKQANMMYAMRDKSYDEIIEWVECYHKLYTGIFDPRVDEHLEEYNGPYPAELEAHPWFGLSKEGFGL